MEVLVVSQEEVAALLPMSECIDEMAEALAALAKGEAEMPLRSVTWLPGQRGALAAMPAVWPTAGAMGVKVISVIPANRGTELDSHQGAVLLFEAERGSLLAIIDATEVTAIRTAAVSGLATRLLARENARELAIMGSGTQARTHLEAMVAVMDVGVVRVWSPSEGRARAFAEQASERLRVRVDAVGSPRDAVEGADVVCTCTSAREPILPGAWLSPGMHVNAIGAVGPGNRELDADAVSRARLFVDRRESAMSEAGEVVIALREGAIGEDHILGDLGELVLGSVTGRTGPDDITLFRGVGLAVEDLAAVRLIHRRATHAGAGTPVELGGGRRAG